MNATAYAYQDPETPPDEQAENLSAMFDHEPETSFWCADDSDELPF